MEPIIDAAGKQRALRAVEFAGPRLNGRWTLGPRLAGGGQGQTYLARDDEMGRVVVVKKLVLGDGGWKKFDLFEREVAVLRSLDHPGVPRYLDQFEGDGGTFYLVMQRAPGADLRRELGRSSLDEADLRDILERALDILDYLHGRSPPVIHRDIKPANLVRDRTGELMLVDFGGVRNALREQGGSTVIGTFGYMAPEQLHGEASPATDIYGLGATIVALAGGVEPEKVPRRGLKMDLERHLGGHLGRGLIELLEAMTDPDPESRPQSSGEVGARLAGLRSPRRRRRRRRARPEPALAPTEALEAITQDDGVMPLDLGVPQPFEAVLRIVVWAFATGGYLALSVLRALVLPIAFTVVSAFAGQNHRKGLHQARDATYRAVGEGRRGFRRLQRAARLDRKQLPPGHRR